MEGEKKKDEPNAQADDNSIAVGRINIGGDVSGTITIGHGYTAEQVSVLLKQITTTFQPKPFDGRCPYKGLEVFEEDDAELFFGRERLVEDLISRVKESRTVFITGPSGSGKSSLVRAGLIHALKKGAIKDSHSERWLYETMKPGREPIKDLALAFSRLKSPDLSNYFLAHKNEINILNECAESVLSGQKNQRFVLFIDQFEEVFTQVSHEEERLAFLNMLARVATIENGRMIVLFAMRSDFVSNCATYPMLNELLSQEFRQIGAMQPEELVSAIALPARHVGLPIEDELIARIINDMKGEPGTLPLMQFALKDLFDSQHEKSGVIALTLEDYLQHGGIHKSLERHADATIAKFSESEQELARSIFSGLIEIGRGTQDTKRTALFDELVPANTKAKDVEAIVQRLADARLIITDEQAGKDTVTISHEKLIEAWPWLKKLVNENRDVISLQNEITSDAKEWEEHKRDASYLYTGARLASAREQLKARKLVLGGLAQLFIETGSKAYADDLEAARQRATQLRRRSIYLTGALVAALMAVGIAVFYSVEAREQANNALHRQLVAQSEGLSLDNGTTAIQSGLLAVEAGKRGASWGTDQALHRYLTKVGLPIASMPHRYDYPVNSTVFSPNGKYVVSGSSDGTVRVWEAVTGKEIARMTHESGVHSVTFSQDGQYVVSGSSDGTARVWEATTGKEIARMIYGGSVHSVAFSPDGKWVASDGCNQVDSSGSCLQGSVRVWEATTGKEIAYMIQDENWVSTVVFSPNGKYVVSGSADGIARVWEAATGKEIARMTHESSVNSVSFSRNSKYIVSGSDDGTARVWEATTGQEIARMTHDSFVWSVVFSSDDKYVVSGSDDGSARVWEADTGQEIARMTHEYWVNSVAFSPDTKYVVSGSDDGTARVWEADTGQEIARMTHDGEVHSVAFSPNGKYVVSGSADGIARVWEAITRKDFFHKTHDDWVFSATFSPDGKFIVSGSRDGTARVWELTTGNEMVRITHENSVLSSSFSPNGKYVVSGSVDGTARVWEATTGKEVARMIHDDWVNSVAFSPDGKYIVSGSRDGTARVWEIFSGQEIAQMAHDQSVNSVAFSPDGKYVISGSNDATARVWEVATGEEIMHVTHNDSVSSVAFSPDGRYIVSGSYDNTVRLSEVTTSKAIQDLTHDFFVESIAFSSDGKYIVSGSRDGTARVWDTATGKEIARIAHDDWVNSVAFSPDDKYLVSGSVDNTAHVWYWQIEDLIGEACKRLPRNLTRIEWAQYIGNEPYQATCVNLPLEPEITASFFTP